MNTILRIQVPAAVLLVVLLAGCKTTPRWDAKFGDSVRATLNQRVALPDAGANPRPVNGMDSRAARAELAAAQGPVTSAA